MLYLAAAKLPDGGMPVQALTQRFPAVAWALESLSDETVIDAEIVAVNQLRDLRQAPNNFSGGLLYWVLLHGSI
jgi:hypothetical protein